LLQRVEHSQRSQDANQASDFHGPAGLDVLDGQTVHAGGVPKLTLGEIALQPRSCQPGSELGEHSFVGEFRVDSHNAYKMTL
jgi:hypothetical protein